MEIVLRHQSVVKRKILGAFKRSPKSEKGKNILFELKYQKLKWNVDALVDASVYCCFCLFEALRPPLARYVVIIQREVFSSFLFVFMLPLSVGILLGQIYICKLIAAIIRSRKMWKIEIVSVEFACCQHAWVRNKFTRSVFTNIVTSLRQILLLEKARFWSLKE